MRVHPDPRTGVHLDDHRAVLAERDGDVLRDDVDAGHIESDRGGGHLARGDVVGVQLIRAIDRRSSRREVRRLTEEYLLAVQRHAVERVPLRRQIVDRLVVRREMGEDLRVPDPPARIAILLLDQRAHRLRPIARDARRHPLGARDDLPVHHEHAMVVPQRELLDHDLAAELLRDVERAAQRRLVVQAPRDSSAVARVERLDDERKADLLRDVDRVLHGAHDVALRHGQADVPDHALGLVLVLRDFHGDGAGAIGHRRLDAAQVSSETQLHERAVVESPHGNAAAPSLLDDRRRRRAESYALVQSLEIVHQLCGVERLTVDRGADDPRRLVHALDADGFLLVGHDDPPHPFVARRHDAAEAHVAPRERLQLERHVLEHVRQPRAFLQSFDESARTSPTARMLAQRRQRGEQALGESR